MSNRTSKIFGVIAIGLGFLLVAVDDLSAATRNSGSKSQTATTAPNGNASKTLSGGSGKETPKNTAVAKDKKPSKAAKACGSSNTRCENRCNKNSSSNKGTCLNGCTWAYSNCLDRAL